MSNTVTFKIKEKQEVVTEVTLQIPSYYRNGSTYVMLHSEVEFTRVRYGGLVDSIEYDDFYGFNPANYVSITEEEFRSAYDDCEQSIRNRTFSRKQDDIQQTGS